MTPFSPARICLVFAVVTLVFLGLGPAARAQSARLPGRVAVSATVGVFSPIDNAMSDVYGSRLMPLTAQVDVRLVPDVSLFAGLRWISADGQAVVVGTPVVNETSTTSLGVTAFRIGAQVAKTVAPRWTLAAGAGVVIASYEETWAAAGQRFSNRSNGFMVLAEGRYALRSRWGVLGRVEYATVRAKVQDASSAVNLGGVDVSAGVRVTF